MSSGQLSMVWAMPCPTFMPAGALQLANESLQVFFAKAMLVEDGSYESMKCVTH
jgi:hypothetical protein